MGSIEDMTMAISRMSFEERTPRRVSFIRIKSRANRQMVIIVDTIPKKMIKPIF
jgi:hypothetical protein